jgi:lysyl-tRNA synthetase class I
MQVLPSPIKYAGVICFKCRSAHGETAVIGRSKVIWKCDDCGSSKEGDFKEFNYWWYHKPMLIARIKIFKVDITLSGGDHFNEGDFKIREIFIRKYAPGMREPKMMFTPTVIALDGIKMSKSRNNAAFADAGRLIEIMNGYKRKEFAIVSDLMQSELDEKDYSNIL